MISCGFCEGSCYVTTFYVELLWFFLMSCWLCPFFKIQIVCGMGLSFDFFVFYYFFLRLKIVFKRIIYPVLNWVNPVWVPLVSFS